MFDLINGDCLAEMKSIPAGSIDMILADPPYGITACKWDSVIPLAPLWDQLNRIIKRKAAIVLHAGQPFTSALVMSNIKNFKYCWVWEKPQGVDPFLARFRPLNNIEDIILFSAGTAPYIPQIEKGEPYKSERDKKPRKFEKYDRLMRPTKTINKGTRLPKRILKFKSEHGLHPTQKPVPLMEYLIKTYTKTSDHVLDFTMGSGSTGVACGNLGRRFTGIELDEKYFKIAEDRILRAYAKGMLE